MRRKDGDDVQAVPVRVFQDGQVQAALDFAGLGRGAFRQAPHPDNGYTCTYLKADIQEYSAFLAALAIQCRAADVLAPLVDQVQLQYDSSGDTRFWLPGLAID